MMVVCMSVAVQEYATHRQTTTYA